MLYLSFVVGGIFVGGFCGESFVFAFVSGDGVCVCVCVGGFGFFFGVLSNFFSFFTTQD